MIQRLCNHSAIVIVGMALGAALVAGWHGATSLQPARAVATHGSDNFAIATGLVDDEIEALYFLDFLTGDLRAAIVNRRNAQFTAYFQHNVLADFQAASDQPKFLMVTGLAGLPRGAGPTQIGKSLIYVAEASSGQVAAYALPYNSTLQAGGAPQRGGFIKVAQGSFRDAFVRDP
ncbi:MAG: hypothetical protein DCC67_18345 [Planctomycetota bacterium]|nr:MAG: hypothetical protein DCC67_18345 [Planctomycetota bacterium]